MQQGPFAPRALPRFNATTDPAATVSSSTVFPGPPVYAVYLAPSISRRDEDGFSSCLACPCHRAVPTTPPEGCASSDTLATHPVAFVRHEKTRPLGSIFLSGPPMGSLVLRPGDSLTILKMALSVSFIRLVLHERDSSYGALTFSPVGLFPTEHASLRWTHSCPKTRTERQGRILEAFSKLAETSRRGTGSAIGDPEQTSPADHPFRRPGPDTRGRREFDRRPRIAIENHCRVRQRTDCGNLRPGSARAWRYKRTSETRFRSRLAGFGSVAKSRLLGSRSAPHPPFIDIFGKHEFISMRRPTPS